ncbi:hypothetical protein PVAP13_4NG299511 [Panicum virgatum]|uniref:Uncharacterized protein n=1 Tax=Panicum virgatum TaxID=38727 RepID=A0A8T0T804_PANVG|nr:hypothetical protein PVAP13_4NG299511 [Panicum virgatum]
MLLPAIGVSGSNELGARTGRLGFLATASLPATPSMWAHLFLIDRRCGRRAAHVARPPTPPPTSLLRRDNPHATAHREPEQAEGEKNLHPVRLASVLAYLYTPLAPPIP